MNTNIMTLCNLIAQQQGSGIVPFKTKSQDNHEQTELIPQLLADPNGTSTTRPARKDEHVFGKTLLEKMAVDNNVQPQCAKQQKDKENATEDQIFIFTPVNQTTLVIDKPENLQFHLEPLKGDSPKPVESVLIKPNTVILSEEDVTHEQSGRIVMPGQSHKVKPLSSGFSESLHQDLPVKSDNILSEQPLNESAVIIEAQQVGKPAVPDQDTQPFPKTEPVIQENPKESADLTAGRNLNSQSRTQLLEHPQQSNVHDLPDTSQPVLKPASDQANILTGKQANGAKLEHLEAKATKNSLPNSFAHDKKLEPSVPLEKTAPVIEYETPISNIEATAKPVTADQPQVLSAKASIHRMNIETNTENLKSQKPVFSSENKDFDAIRSDKNNFDTQLTAPTTQDKPQVEPGLSKGNSNPGQLNLGRQIEQTVTTLYRPGTQQIVIRLDPPDLGRVTIKFIEHKNQITGILQVEKPETRHEIQQAISGIIQNLQNSDVNIRRLEVVLNNQPQTDPHEQPGYQSGGFDHQNTPHQGSGSNNISYNDWLSGPENQNQPSAEHQNVTEKTINMLI